MKKEDEKPSKDDQFDKLTVQEMFEELKSYGISHKNKQSRVRFLAS